MSTAASTTLLAAPSPDAGTPRLRWWAVALFLFGCFFLAVQDMASPTLWQDNGDADIAGWVNRVDGGQAKRQIGFLALAAFGCLGLILPSRRTDIDADEVSPYWPVLFPLIVFVGWGYLSILWSHDRSLTAKRLIVFTAIWTSVVTLLKHFGLRNFVGFIVVYATLTLLVGIFAELKVGVFGEVASEPYRFAGTMSPNHSALTACMLAIACTYLLTSKLDLTRVQWLGLVALAVVAGLVVFFTRSRTALAAGMLGVGAILALRLRPAWSIVVAVGGILMALVIAFGYEARLFGEVWEVALMGRTTSDVRTLTGRTDIWAFALEHAVRDPTRLVTGFGYDSFWNAANTEAISRRVGFTISEAHNAYLEVLLGTGMIGAVAWLLMLTMGLWYHLSRGRLDSGRWSPDSALAIGVIAMASLHGLAEVAFTHAQVPTMVLLACIAVAAFQSNTHGEEGQA